MKNLFNYLLIAFTFILAFSCSAQPPKNLNSLSIKSRTGSSKSPFIDGQGKWAATTADNDWNYYLTKLDPILASYIQTTQANTLIGAKADTGAVAKIGGMYNFNGTYTGFGLGLNQSTVPSYNGIRLGYNTKQQGLGSLYPYAWSEYTDGKFLFNSKTGTFATGRTLGDFTFSDGRLIGNYYNYSPNSNSLWGGAGFEFFSNAQNTDSDGIVGEMNFVQKFTGGTSEEKMGLTFLRGSYDPNGFSDTKAAGNILTTSAGSAFIKQPDETYDRLVRESELLSYDETFKKVDDTLFSQLKQSVIFSGNNYSLLSPTLKTQNGLKGLMSVNNTYPSTNTWWADEGDGDWLSQESIGGGGNEILDIDGGGDATIRTRYLSARTDINTMPVAPLKGDAFFNIQAVKHKGLVPTYPIKENGAGGTFIKGSVDSVYANGNLSGKLGLYTFENATNYGGAAAERITIKSNGFVGISSLTPRSTLSVNGSIGSNSTVVTANYTATSTDNQFIVNAGSTAITVTLPDPSTCDGREYSFSRYTNATGIITITNSGTASVQALNGSISSTTTIEALGSYGSTPTFKAVKVGSNYSWLRVKN